MAINSIQEYVHGVPITMAPVRRRLGAWRAAVRPSVQHVIDNAYTIAAVGTADAAGFVHSTFCGLITMTVGFLFIEWRSRG
jgi:hypothetical protein